MAEKNESWIDMGNKEGGAPETGKKEIYYPSIVFEDKDIPKNLPRKVGAEIELRARCFVARISTNERKGAPEKRSVTLDIKKVRLVGKEISQTPKKKAGRNYSSDISRFA